MEGRDKMNTTNSLLNVVRDLAEEMIDGDESFTSLDISNYVKKMGYNFCHREVAQTLRERVLTNNFLRDVGYSKTRISVQLSNGQSVPAFLYHHKTVSADDYTKCQQVAVHPVAQQDVTITRRSILDLMPRDTAEVSLCDANSTVDTEEVDEEIQLAESPVVSPARRTLAQAVSKVRRSIFDVASRAQTLVCRRGPKATTSVQLEDTNASYNRGYNDGVELNQLELTKDREYVRGYSAGLSDRCKRLVVTSQEVQPNIVVCDESVSEPPNNVSTEWIRSTTNLEGRLGVREVAQGFLTSEKRLEIPPRWIKTLGWGRGSVAGEAVMARKEYFSGPAVRIVPLNSLDDEEDLSELGIAVVNSDGRLRLPKSIMVQAQELRGRTDIVWTLELLDNSIVIR